MKIRLFLINSIHLSGFQIVGDDCFLHSFWPSPMFQSVFGVFVVFIEFLVPLLVLVCCYRKILWIIRARIKSKIASGNKQTAKFELARNNVIKTLFIVVFFFFVCFLGTEFITCVTIWDLKLTTMVDTTNSL